MNDGVVVVEDGTITYTNPQVSEIVGYSAAELRGEPMERFIAPADRDTVLERFRRRIAGDDPPASYEIAVVSKDGERVPVEITVARIEDDSPVTTVSIVRDVSDRKRRERELERQNERLEEFASVVSHDLRNPLAVAEGRLEMAREDCDSDHLHGVAAAHDRMRTLIDDLLTLARQGETVEAFAPVDLASLVEAAWETVGGAAEGAALVTATDRTVMADRERLRQLLENLFRNALEHGGESVAVSVGEIEDGFYVADDGPGIPPGERKRAFESGYSTTHDGTGFGLSIVEQVARAHGWTVDVTESDDGGARFELAGVDLVE